jgi:hypothetical protein
VQSGISPVALGHAASLFLAIAFTLCVLFDLAFPAHAMYAAWSKLFPGFEWISRRSYLVGFAESYGYGWFFALLWAGLYNFFVGRAGASASERSNARRALDPAGGCKLSAGRVVTVMWHGKPVLIRTADTLGW